jgi:superfamily II DNA or RNA helicase/HKD family nuclease
VSRFITNHPTFISNHPTKDLATRLKDLIEASNELKFLVGFFYFSGWRELYETLRRTAESNPSLKLKVLVGMSVDRQAGRLLEVAKGFRGTGEEASQALVKEFAQALSDPSLDLPDFPEQARFFLQLLKEGRLEVRKTREPNHAKLYLFKVDAPQQKLLGSPGKFITGSSNLTHAGLRGQHEFNVEIGDYGFEEAEAYFDELWKTALPLLPPHIPHLEEIVERGSLAALPSPFEVYALLLRRYLDLLEESPRELTVEDAIKRAGFTPYRYQIDAVKAILRILEAHGGAILADVVGLGKTLVASLVAREVGGRGLVIAPPHLVEEPWGRYLELFGLYPWRAYSTGKLDEALAFAQRADIELVIVDEAHRFRNPETKDYALLSAIIRGRKVLLLTATPLNNRPRDAYALLRLFVPPRASSVGPTRDLEGYFGELDSRFRKASYALRYHKSKDERRRRKARGYYEELTGREPPIEEGRLRGVLDEVARKTRLVLEAVTVRRNRKDLLEDPRYREEAPPFPEVKNPEPLWYGLSTKQSAFYDWVLEEFGPDGSFRGAAYQPELYRLGSPDEEEIGEEERFALESQRNLADFMRRLLVRRFESSFGAFAETLERLAAFHERLLGLMRDHGYYLLHKRALEDVLSMLEEGILDEDSLAQYLEDLLQREEGAIARGERTRQRVYREKDFGEARWREFLSHVEEDLSLLTRVMGRAAQLRLADPNEDPKLQALKEFLKKVLEEDPERKVVVFSEFTDTVAHIERGLSGWEGVLVVGKGAGKGVLDAAIRNFDASLPPSERRDLYRVLVASDRLSEGISLHRANVVINYDIPWNPTRLIQRLGRVNRVGSPFEEVFVYHFFPTEKGASVVDPKAVAQNKLHLIHRALGEDAKILSPEEEPTPSRIYERLRQLPEEEKGESFEAWVRREWERLASLAPGLEERVRKLPDRVKTGVRGEKWEALVVARKGLAFFGLAKGEGEEGERALFLPEVFDRFRDVTPETPRLELSHEFYEAYESLAASLESKGGSAPPSPNSIEVRALNNVRTALQLYRKDFSEEEIAFLRKVEEDLKHHRLLPHYAAWRLQQADLGKPESLEVFRDALNEVRRLFSPILSSPSAPEVRLVVGVEFRDVEKEP